VLAESYTLVRWKPTPPCPHSWIFFQVCSYQNWPVVVLLNSDRMKANIAEELTSPTRLTDLSVYTAQYRTCAGFKTWIAVRNWFFTFRPINYEFARRRRLLKSHKPLLASAEIVLSMKARHVLRYVSAVKRGIVVTFLFFFYLKSRTVRFGWAPGRLELQGFPTVLCSKLTKVTWH
jgi:hypothetical protein